MKTLILALSVLMVSMLSTAAGAMTAEELIDKHLEATGGIEKHRSINSVKVTGKLMMMGMELPFTVLQKRPNMMRFDSDFQGASIVQAYDGEGGWTINPMSGTQDPQDLPAMQELGLKYEADIDGIFIDYAKKGYSVEMIGEDEVEGTPVLHLRLDTGGGVIFDCYFETEYHLMIKQTSTLSLDESELTQDSFLSDFKEVDGIISAHSIESQSEHGSQTIMVDTVEYNVEIADDTFTRPATED